MEIEFEVRQNTRDIATLANTVTRLATLVENSEKRHGEDRETTREIFSNLKGLNEKIGGFTTMQEKVSTLAEQMGGIRHDVKNIENGMQAIPLLKNKEVENEKHLVDHDGRLKALETFKDKHEGAATAVRVILAALWMVFGGAITSMAFYFLGDYFRHQPLPHTLTTMERKEIIGGE